MDNEQLKQTMVKRSESQQALVKSLEKLQGASPMSLMTGGFSNLSGVVAQFESVAHLNDAVITELVKRTLNNG